MVSIALGCAGSPPTESTTESREEPRPVEVPIDDKAASKQGKELLAVAPVEHPKASEIRGSTGTDTVSLVAVGDISLGRIINAEMVDRDDFTFPFEHVNDFIKAADIAIGNLESQMFPGCPVLKRGLRLCASPRAISGLVDAGFDVVSVANNHSDNFGRRALASSVALLRAKGISVAGYDRHPIIERRKIRFGFLAYDITQEVIPLKRVSRDIAAVQSRSDVVVLMMHWGKEYQVTPDPTQTDFAAFAASRGVDVIIGTHPHVVQPLTTVKSAPVAYSLGNFVFDQMWSEETQNAAAASLTFDEGGSVVKANLVPLRLVAPGIPLFSKPKN
ncbi:MAG: CapA family protein [Proteobacteria bacterium]|nr:CapA family protein [Pseudomonadota bacterium]